MSRLCGKHRRMLRLVSWNVARRDVMSYLHPLNADVALLQEAAAGRPNEQIEILPADSTAWLTAGFSPRPWRTAIWRLSDRVELRGKPTVGINEATRADDWVVSVAGSVTAADVVANGAHVFTAVSVYSPWEMGPDRRGYADASAHRILSDLSILLGSSRHRVVVAGDWNILRGYGEHGSALWKARYATVFDRAEALGLRFVGPEYPNGRRASPWPDELPPDSLCVPTFHHNRQRPETATRQLDFVFASATISNHVSATALNGIEEWGPSDHCRVVIDVDL